MLWLFASASLLTGCAAGSDGGGLFVDPAKYALYDCAQLLPQRKTEAARVAELQALMMKAESGPAGGIMSELAYRSDLVSAQASLKAAEAAWERNRCDAAAVTSEPSLARPSPGVSPSAGRSRGRVY